MAKDSITCSALLGHRLRITATMLKPLKVAALAITLLGSFFAVTSLAEELKLNGHEDDIIRPSFDDDDCELFVFDSDRAFREFYCIF